MRLKTCATAFLLIVLIRTAPAVDWYVATNGTGLGTGGWANATNSLQGAIDKITSGTVWVSNGVYATGGTNNWPSGTLLTNRIAITKTITVMSQNNDPTNTIIVGAWDPATNGPAAIRCVYMVANSMLIGFTLTNGATMVSTDPYAFHNYGGGVYCPMYENTPVVSNCIITGNSSYYGGGGMYYGTLRNSRLIGNTTTANHGGAAVAVNMYYCTLIGNTASAWGGGARYGTFYYCTFTNNTATCGGAAYQSTLINCIISGNYASWGGGGVMDCGSFGIGLFNCLVTGNTAGAGAGGGGGTYRSDLYNCTVAGNSVTAGNAGGVYAGVLHNCVVYLNSGSSYSNYQSSAFTNSCTAPAAAGWAAGNIAGDPKFINGAGRDYRLAMGSPCINTGTNMSWTTTYPYDLDFRRRIRYGVVDMGAYESIRSGSIYGFH